MPLPNPSMVFVPFDILTAAEMNDLVENDQALAAGTGFNIGAIPTAAYADSSVTSPKVATGFAVQVVSVGYSAVATGTTVIPNDDTLPQNTEGTEFMTLSITPKSATNILVIEVIAMLSTNTANNLIGALFQDATSNALAASMGRDPAGATPTMNVLRHRMVAGTTSATTFKFRAGPSSGTMTFNGASGARLYSTATKSSIVITEIKA